jgi:hypothetical protein
MLSSRGVALTKSRETKAETKSRGFATNLAQWLSVMEEYEARGKPNKVI